MLVGCGVVLLAVLAFVLVCMHDCAIYFWTPRRKVAASGVLRRHGLKNAAMAYAVPSITTVTTVMVQPMRGVPDVEETST